MRIADAVPVLLHIGRGAVCGLYMVLGATGHEGRLDVARLVIVSRAIAMSHWRDTSKSSRRSF